MAKDNNHGKHPWSEGSSHASITTASLDEDGGWFPLRLNSN
jgi:hypothetical protein